MVVGDDKEKNGEEATVMLEKGRADHANLMIRLHQLSVCISRKNIALTHVHMLYFY